MSFFSHLSIKNKILAVVLTIVLLELALFAGGIYFLNATSNQLTRLVDIDAEKMKLAAYIRTDMLEIHRSQKNSILLDSQEEIARQVHRKNRYIAELRLHLAGLDRYLDQRERTSLIELKSELEAFLKVDGEIESLVFRPDRAARLEAVANPTVHAAAVALSTSSARQAYDKASDQIGKIVDDLDAALVRHRKESEAYFDRALTWMLGLCFAGIAFGWLTGLLVARRISGNLEAVVTVTDAIAKGNLDTPVVVASGDETGRLAASVQKMQNELIAASKSAADRDWIKNGLARVNDVMRGQVSVSDLCHGVIAEIASYLEVAVGAVFLTNNKGAEPVLEFAAGYAYSNVNRLPARFQVGEGLAGQALLAKAPISVRDVPSDYIKVCSGLGDSCPTCITVAPMLYEDQPCGIAELGFLRAPSDLQLEYLQLVLPSVAINVETVRGREKLAESLARAQVLTEELQQQQDELKAANEELEEQTQRLRQSEDKLKQQQNELEEANAELEEKNAYLQNQKEMIERANCELETIRRDIEEKAEQLAMAGKYKSEFLANMSHELRTPLNSILLLARMLNENKDANLTPEQVRSAEIIYNSGSDLLTLINEVLDLSRIEAGRMELHIQPLDVQTLADSITRDYSHVVRDKGLSIEVHCIQDHPAALQTDRKRLNQILRNLISNAVKFTEEGGIRITIERPSAASLPAEMVPENALAISVTDSGIGIPAEKQKIVFDAFQQLDTGAARKFAGTGLGLSISRDLARLMGGDIQLQSRPGVGSTFTLLLPIELSAGQTATGGKQAAVERGALRPPPRPADHPAPAQTAGAALQNLPDDRADIADTDAVILIVEDDAHFAEHLIGLCRQRKFKVLHAPTGEQGLELAAEFLPKGILLDIHLPKKNGWAVLDCLKQTPDTRHIPVHILSIEDATIEAYASGAIGFLTKPARREDIEAALAKLENIFDRQIKELLVVEDDDALRENIIKLIGNHDVNSDEAANAAEAIAAVRAKQYDCMILDLGLPDMNGLDMLRLLEKEKMGSLPPVIVYTGRELTREQDAELQNYSESIIIKGARSEERLYDEASLFLHRIVAGMPEKKRRLITNLYDTDIMFRDKTVLISDDDMRSVFALCKLLEEKGVRMIKAENGRRALELLKRHPDTDLILMDMMMPVMDGYETMQRIRSEDQWRQIPIIALTAKAMKQDRDRCIAAGASDYLTKPVDMERLLSMMRIWLYR